jgi:hypothetical protein
MSAAERVIGVEQSSATWLDISVQGEAGIVWRYNDGGPISDADAVHIYAEQRTVDGQQRWFPRLTRDENGNVRLQQSDPGLPRTAIFARGPIPAAGGPIVWTTWREADDYRGHHDAAVLDLHVYHREENPRPAEPAAPAGA